ncbi:MAG: hypothetical protein ACLUOI_26590 [Eisenbergiella sp.]
MTLVIDGSCAIGQKGCMDAYCSAKVLAEYADGNLDDFFTDWQREMKAAVPHGKRI